MSRFPRLAAAALFLASPAQAAGEFGLGRPALPAEIAAWDVDVLPDGTGLPPGRGDVLTGEALFSDHCAACHGEFAEGAGNWPELAGGEDTLADEDPVKTVGSYWPYLSTVWDYVHRSMPYGAAQTLTDDEVYAIVAYILYSNDLVDEAFELNHGNFRGIALPNAGGFKVDDRAEAEYPLWRREPCMRNCREGVTISMRATVLDVTPEDSVPPHAVADALAQAAAGASPALVAAGERVFRKCRACHAVRDDGKRRIGPALQGVIGRLMGSVEGFRYSRAIRAAADAGQVWDETALAGFLHRPRKFMNGTSMAFAGLRKEDDIAAVIAYLKSFGD